ncbi:MAG: hypothetical protein F9K29_03605 [Hyphomicrobiaceae bacterium]|nr:MAG: hypothetical protein F9K29_03605 [Hyphomicrobiaceae bacterium]
MTQDEQLLPTDYTDELDNPANLPPNQIVTATQLRMRPGQKLAEKAKELGVSQLTLRIWEAEWRGSGYDPDYVLRRAGHNNWLKNKWEDRDWIELLRQQIAKRQHRHVGDLLLALGLTAWNAQLWSHRHPEFEKLLWAEPHPGGHWRDFIAWLRHPVIDDYRKRKANHIADGMPEIEAMHTAADEAVNKLRHETRQRRRVERDTLLGVGGHEELLRRYRGNAKLHDAHSRRIAKKLQQVGRWVAMERGLRECGYSEPDIKRTMGELMGAFRKSDKAGQAQWQKTRKAVLRRHADAEAYAKAEEIEAKMVREFVGVRQSKYVKAWAREKYGR